MLWMDRHTNESYAALLEHEWILDLDATVKTLYGRQEEARVGYNPTKPGRPSPVYQAMLLRNTRTTDTLRHGGVGEFLARWCRARAACALLSAAKLVLNVDLQAGNQMPSTYAQPTLWG